MEVCRMDLYESEQLVYDRATTHIKAVRAGAEHHFSEYESLLKEYGRLLRHLRRVTRLSDRTTVDLHKSNLDLRDQTHHDALTGIPNRRYMEENLKRVIKSTARSNGVLSVLMVDVDFFKRYNDTYGHSKGDDCLIAVAKALHSCITRADDFVARYGGEEFIVVLPNTNENGARVMAGRMLESMIACRIPHENSDAASYVTISIGGTTGQAKHTQAINDYVKCADEALYQSKHNGRNRYSFVSLAGNTE